MPCKFAGLCSGAKLDAFLDTANDFVSDHDRFRKLFAAVHNAVTHRVDVGQSPPMPSMDESPEIIHCKTASSAALISRIGARRADRFAAVDRKTDRRRAADALDVAAGKSPVGILGDLLQARRDKLKF